MNVVSLKDYKDRKERVYLRELADRINKFYGWYYMDTPFGKVTVKPCPKKK